MKKYKAIFWRSNPQLPKGGYETTRSIEAKTPAAAEKKARGLEAGVAYGSMSLIRIEEE